MGRTKLMEIIFVAVDLGLYVYAVNYRRFNKGHGSLGQKQRAQAFKMIGTIYLIYISAHLQPK